MRLYRSSFVLTLFAFVSASMLHAAQTGVLTCNGTTPIKVSYFDVANPTPVPGSVGKLTIHAAFQQFGTLQGAMGSELGSCTLTHNSSTFTFLLTLLTNVDAIAGAASTGVAGAATYTQATFEFGAVNVTGGDDGDGGGDDGGWNRVTNGQN